MEAEPCSAGSKLRYLPQMASALEYRHQPDVAVHTDGVSKVRQVMRCGPGKGKQH